MKGICTELKVGAFVIIGALILAALVFQIGGISIFRNNSYAIQAVFSFVSGVSNGAPVHVAGVHVGDVRSVDIVFNKELNQSQVRLTMSISNEVRIPADSHARINALGILGDKYVEIVLGNDRTLFLKDGGVIAGVDPIQMAQFAERLVNIFGATDVQESLRASIVNLGAASEDIRKSAARLDALLAGVEQGKGTIGLFLTDESVYRQTESMVVTLNENLDTTVKDLNTNLNELIMDFRRNPWKLFQKPPPQITETSGQAAQKKRKRGFLFWRR